MQRYAIIEHCGRRIYFFGGRRGVAQPSLTGHFCIFMPIGFFKMAISIINNLFYNMISSTAMLIIEVGFIWLIGTLSAALLTAFHISFSFYENI